MQKNLPKKGQTQTKPCSTLAITRFGCFCCFGLGFFCFFFLSWLVNLSCLFFNPWRKKGQLIIHFRMLGYFSRCGLIYLNMNKITVLNISDKTLESFKKFSFLYFDSTFSMVRNFSNAFASEPYYPHLISNTSKRFPPSFSNNKSITGYSPAFLFSRIVKQSIRHCKTFDKILLILDFLLKAWLKELIDEFLWGMQRGFS